MKVRVVFKHSTGCDGINYNTGDSLIMDDVDISKKKITNHVDIYPIEEKIRKEAK
jgi:hypothetical protein